VEIKDEEGGCLGICCKDLEGFKGREGELDGLFSRPPAHEEINPPDPDPSYAPSAWIRRGTPINPYLRGHFLFVIHHGLSLSEVEFPPRAETVLAFLGKKRSRVRIKIPDQAGLPGSPLG
jgi:hypothetical protein